MRKTEVWLWKEPDNRWKENVISHIKKSDYFETDEDLVILHCMEIEDFCESIPLTKYMLSLCQVFGIFKNERTMFLNPKDLLQAVELCLGRLSNVFTETKAEDDDIVQCHKAYLEHFHLKDQDKTEKSVSSLKKFIGENNCADVWLINDKLSDQKVNNADFFNLLPHSRFLILGTPPSEIFQKLISLLTSKQTVLNILVETPLNISLQGSPSIFSTSKIDVISESLNVKDIPFDTENGIKLGSATEEYVEETIVSFLSLLVNSRNELALSKAMISPIIELSHEAFTKLKHLSEEKEMPMCQTAVSYVTRIKLGGKGYAPPSDCPMLPHLKKIELFVDTLNQMQTIIEEDLTAISAVKRLINILTKKLLKCSNDKLRPSSIETASKNLKNMATKVLGIQSECTNTTPQVCDATLDFLHSFINYMNCSSWNFDPKHILSMRYSKRTPICLPPLLGYFRTPEDESSCDIKSVQDEESRQSNISEPPPFMSYFHHSESSSVTGTCIDSLTPSRMNFKDCLKVKVYDDNESMIGSDVKEVVRSNSICNKGRKRSILSEITNENSQEKIRKNIEKKPKKLSAQEVKASKTKNSQVTRTDTQIKMKGSKKFKQIEGQGKITSFFIKR